MPAIDTFERFCQKHIKNWSAACAASLPNLFPHNKHEHKQKLSHTKNKSAMKVDTNSPSETREGEFMWIDNVWDALKEEVHLPSDALPVQKTVPQKEIDSLLASELNQMSLQERESQYEQLHGVEPVDIFQETPEFVQSKLQALEAELFKIKSKDAYEQALHMNRAYVEDPKFRLMFLRADRFNPAKAAARVVLFMEKKRRFFGVDSMCRSLTLDDLDKGDRDALESGFLQLLPVRDRAGRLVLIDSHATGARPFKSDINAVSYLRAATIRT